MWSPDQAGNLIAKHSRLPQFALDCQQAGLLGPAIETASRAGLNFPAIYGNGKVGHKVVLWFTRTVRNHKTSACIEAKVNDWNDFTDGAAFSCATMVCYKAQPFKLKRLFRYIAISRKRDVSLA